jgi:hypothetical protein
MLGKNNLRMTKEETLKEMAAKLIWWQPAEVSLEQPRRLLGQVMTLGDWPEVVAFKNAFGWEAFRDALVNAEPGLFDLKSWVMWHHFFGVPVPELPQRAFMKDSVLGEPLPQFQALPGGLVPPDKDQ